MQETGDKVHICNFTSDTQKCILEDCFESCCQIDVFPAGFLQENDGSDSQVNTLRWCLKRQKRKGWWIGHWEAIRPSGRPKCTRATKMIRHLVSDFDV